MKQKRIQAFGSDVALVVGPLRSRAVPLAASINDLMRLERLEGFMRAVKWEGDLSPAAHRREVPTDGSLYKKLLELL
jgi:hypothetical protein